MNPPVDLVRATLEQAWRAECSSDIYLARQVVDLRGLVAADRATIAEQAAEITALRTQIERLGDHVARGADTWTSLTPEQRTAIRRQSEELYNLMGRTATAYYYPSREEQK